MNAFFLSFKNALLSSQNKILIKFMQKNNHHEIKQYNHTPWPFLVYFFFLRKNTVNAHKGKNAYGHQQ